MNTKTNYDFDQIVNRRDTYSIKWDGENVIKEKGLTDRYDTDTLPLFTADMDLPVSQPIVEALHKTVDNRIYGYSVLPGEYYEAIQYWFKRRHNWNINKEEIVYSPGTVHALNVAVRAFTNPSDGIMIQRPVYPPFMQAIEDNNRKVKNNALLKNEDGYYSIDFDDFEEKAKDKQTKMFILCNPHNPTGRIFSDEDLKRMAKICHENNVLIIADEIHGDLIRSYKTFTPIACVADNDDHIVTLTAINKTFNVAGLHCSNAIIPNSRRRKIFKDELGNQMPSPFSISALIAAYNAGVDWLEQLKKYLDETMAFVKSFMDEKMPKVKVNIPEGTYVVWLDFSGYGISPEEVHDRIYNKANVILQDGFMFGAEGRNFQRICIPSPRSVIHEALNRIEREFSDLR